MIKLPDISAIAAARPDSPALVCSDYSLSWSSVEASVANLVASLAAHIDTETVTQAVFVSRNRIELVLMMATFATLGIPLCGIDYTLDADGIRDAMRAVDADFAIVSSQHLGSVATDVLKGLSSRSIVDLDDALPDAIHLSTLTLPYRQAGPRASPPRTARIVAFTSGTSGSPKPTLRTASTDLRRFGYFTRRFAFHADDRYLLNMPLYHVAGNGWARHFMGLGATIVLVPVDDPRCMADAISTRRITAMVTTPSNLAGILAAMDASDKPQRHALRFLLVGGKNFGPNEKARALEVLGPVVHEYYGSTETGVNTIADPDDLASYPASVGRTYDGNRVVVLDEDDAILPPGRRGRIAVSSYLLMEGYIGVRTNEVVIGGERFLITPDQGYLDEDARLYLLNRASGSIGNFDVYTAENALRSITGVTDAAVLTSTCGSSEVKVDCALTLDHAADERHVLMQARSILIENNVPYRHVRSVDSIPYSLSGKIRSTVLSTMISRQCAGSIRASQELAEVDASRADQPQSALEKVDSLNL